jgi:chemotaxis protein MotB
LKFKADVEKLNEKFSQDIEKLDKKFSQLEKNYLQTNQKLQKEQMKTEAIQKLYSLQRKILNNLKEAFPQNDALQLDNASLDLKNKKLFNVGDINPKEDSIKILIGTFETYIDTLMKDEEVRPYIKHIILEGYTDSSGEYELNKTLSLQRAKLIKDHLLKSEVSKKYSLDNKIQTKGLANLNPIMKNGIEDAEASRRIKIRFELDKEKIINSIKKILND